MLSKKTTSDIPREIHFAKDARNAKTPIEPKSGRIMRYQRLTPYLLELQLSEQGLRTGKGIVKILQFQA